MIRENLAATLAFAAAIGLFAAACMATAPTPEPATAIRTLGATPLRWTAPTLVAAARAPIPIALDHATFAVASGQLHVIAGNATARPDGRTSIVERYDPQNDRWDRLPDLPITFDHGQAAALGSDIYVFGGWIGSGNVAEIGRGTPRSFRYMSGTGSWAEIARMPEPRGAGAAVELAGRIYVMGGKPEFGSFLAPEVQLASVYVYEPTTDAWRRVADLPGAGDHLSAVAFRGRVCALGGRATPEAFRCYDPASDRWEALPRLPGPPGDVSAVVAGNLLWFFGEQVFAFDGVAWSSPQPLPSLADQIPGALGAIGGTIYVVGTSGKSNHPPQPGTVLALRTS